VDWRVLRVKRENAPPGWLDPDPGLPDEQAGQAPQVGYIRISGFDRDTDAEFDYALKDLAADGVEGIVIDLRGNAGGLLEVALRVAERFLPEGEEFLRVHWASGVEVIRARTSSEYAPLEGVPLGPDGRLPWPVAVLVDGRTASAAEILTASLREAGVARVFGEKTYGKGSVQTVFPLSDGGAVKVTTATWTTGEGVPIDGVGVTPDEIISPDMWAGPREPRFTPICDRWVFKRGDHGTDIVHLQERLKQLGYYHEPVDGVFWVWTERALEAFQRDVGLGQSGVADRATIHALNKARLADHPAGRSALIDNPRPPRPPEVTGDPVTDRAVQWLGEVLEGSPGQGAEAAD